MGADQSEFPRFMCRAGGTWQLESGLFTCITVANAEEMAAATKNGFHPDQYTAIRAAAVADRGGDDNRPPTREELEQKATELGIAFKPQTSNKKLSADIAAKLAEQG